MDTLIMNPKRILSSYNRPKQLFAQLQLSNRKQGSHNMLNNPH